MYVGNRVAEPVRVGEHNLEFVHTFNYLGSTICYDGGAGSDIGEKYRLSKARSAYCEAEAGLEIESV